MKNNMFVKFKFNNKGDGLGQVIATILLAIVVIAVIIKVVDPLGTGINAGTSSVSKSITDAPKDVSTALDKVLGDGDGDGDWFNLAWHIIVYYDIVKVSATGDLHRKEEVYLSTPITKFKMNNKGSGVDTVVSMVICTILILYIVVYVIFTTCNFIAEHYVNNVLQQCVNTSSKVGYVNQNIDNYLNDKLSGLVGQFYGDLNVTYFVYNIEDYDTSTDYYTAYTSVPPEGIKLNKGQIIGIGVEDNGESILVNIIKFINSDYSSSVLSCYKEQMTERWTYIE